MRSEVSIPIEHWLKLAPAVSGAQFSLRTIPPNKAPEPTPGSVTPRAFVRELECHGGLVDLLLHAARQLPAWLIFDVGQSKRLRAIHTAIDPISR